MKWRAWPRVNNSSNMIEMGILCKLIACKKRKKLKYNFRVKSWAEVIIHGPLTFLERNWLLPKPTFICLTIIVFLSDQTFDSEMWILKIMVFWGIWTCPCKVSGFSLVHFFIVFMVGKLRESERKPISRVGQFATVSRHYEPSNTF